MSETTTPIIKVLVVDDSALIRKLLTTMLNEAPDIEVVGTAGDPYIARERIKQLKPDVLTLDVEMPRMDGVTFLRNLMRLHPMPVVMVSSLTEKGADVTLDALALGAFDFVSKPKLDVQSGLALLADELRDKVRAAARTPVRPLGQQPGASPRGTAARGPSTSASPPARRRHLRTTDRLIAIGASTGGTEAIREVLCALPPDAPGVVIAQHIPPRFSAAFAKRVDSLAAIRVKEAEDGEVILPGHAYVAPGGHHLRVRRSGGRYLCQIGDDAPVNRHRPSVDVLFDSLAEAAGPNACAALLTGMGADGARGLLGLREAGALTLVQDQATSVVWGMPGEAVKLGAAEAVLPLAGIAQALLAHSDERVTRSA
ncbi:MAG: chemotaxis response regulator protein-glutamate methylesterase [Gammaproteobacteria bacterium]|nr:chemotaxis response regulator protein-glutamate methylesterase [Gammaproteobacteria bacterium]MCC5869897.1 chemotaxis response regulator protein-glutamate methylesterase [Gammaproteobacteria bacterium]